MAINFNHFRKKCSPSTRRLLCCQDPPPPHHHTHTQKRPLMLWKVYNNNTEALSIVNETNVESLLTKIVFAQVLHYFIVIFIGFLASVTHSRNWNTKDNIERLSCITPLQPVQELLSHSWQGGSLRKTVFSPLVSLWMLPISYHKFFYW